ncbi:prepilin-type N-terminal cleavage/methylation domain-containing protein [Rummeliibacillus sp. JY-2-4R]
MKNDTLSDLQGIEPTYKKGENTMKSKMKKLMKNQKGMTLIELLAVIVIIAIIAVIAIPAIGNVINNSRDKAVLADASNIISGARIAFQDDACKTTTGDTDGTTCDASELASYVEADLASGDKVVKSISGNTITYTLTFGRLANIKNDKFKKVGETAVISTSDTSVTSVELKKLMDQ